MNVKSVILIVAALLFAGGTAFVASRLISTTPPPVAKQKEEPAKKVLVAKGNLPAGTFIKEEDLTWQKWPTDGVNENYLLDGQADMDTVVGAVVRKGIVAGEPITEAQIARPGDRGFLAAVLTPGMRAISIAVNEPSSVAGLIFPGDRLDVLLNLKFKNGENDSGAYEPRTSETVLENVRLLATDRRLDDIEGEPKKVKTITIEVTPKQAEMIKVAASMGDLHMSLRGLAKPEGQSAGPTVASAQATATPAAFRAETVAETPEKDRQAKPNSQSVFDEELPERGETYTFDLEVSRPMQELMHPGGLVEVIRGSNSGDPSIQIIQPGTQALTFGQQQAASKQQQQQQDASN
jgi:pilus assembly protein CpaB